jgi:hypothetical protein
LGTLIFCLRRAEAKRPASKLTITEIPGSCSRRMAAGGVCIQRTTWRSRLRREPPQRGLCTGDSAPQRTPASRRRGRLQRPAPRRSRPMPLGAPRFVTSLEKLRGRKIARRTPACKPTARNLAAEHLELLMPKCNYFPVTETLLHHQIELRAVYRSARGCRYRDGICAGRRSR